MRREQIERWNQMTVGPVIPDKGETSEEPDPLSGQRQRHRHRERDRDRDSVDCKTVSRFPRCRTGALGSLPFCAQH